MSGLFAAQQVSSPANFQVFRSDGHPGSQPGVGSNRFQPLKSRFVHSGAGRIEEVSVATFPPAPDSSAKLMQLGQAKAVRMVHDDCVGAGHIQPVFDNSRGHQHIEFLVPEIHHHRFQLFFRHLPVPHPNPRFGHQLGEVSGNPIDGLHPVMYEKYLTVTQKFAPDGGRDLFIRVGSHIGQDRVAVLGWGGEGAHAANPGDGHLQSARNRGGAHRQNVNVSTQSLEGFLVLHPETLFFVNHHQAQVFKPDIARQQGVGSDYHFDGAVFQPGFNPGGILSCGKA